MIERLKEKRLKFNKTQNEMAEIIGISRSTYTGIEKGKATLTERNKMLIIDKLNVNPIWFETGEGEMLKSNFTQSDVRNVDTQTMNWIQIPFIPVHARATFAETFETEIHELSTLTIPRLPGINYENGKVFEVDGDSMDPTLITGEQVFCEYVDPADWKYITGPVVVAFGNNLIVVKRIKENNLSNGELTLWSDNEMGGKFTLHTEQDQIRRMYKVRYTVYKPIR